MKNKLRAQHSKRLDKNFKATYINKVLMIILGNRQIHKIWSLKITYRPIKSGRRSLPKTKPPLSNKRPSSFSKKASNPEINLRNSTIKSPSWNKQRIKVDNYSKVRITAQPQNNWAKPSWPLSSSPKTTSPQLESNRSSKSSSKPSFPLTTISLFAT